MEIENNKPYLRRWWIVGSLLVGTWVGTLGSSMIPVALPSILKHFDTPLNTGIWLISIYTLMVAVFMPVFGWLGNRYGYRRIYFLGLSGFAIFSYMAAIAPNIESLIIFRVLQGIFNATTPPCVMGIISRTFPANERGSAMGVWATVNGAAHGLGPVISGSMIIFFGWSSIFLFMGTCTLIGLFLIFYFVPPDYDKSQTESRKFGTDIKS
ncbi:MFS transporter, partial [Thermodesulfobacteriota bacterium]